jgi:DNA polymerase
MTSAVKSKLLNHLNMLNSMGYKYMQPIDLKEINQEQVVMPNNYDALKSMAINCNLCELSKSRNSVVFGQGNLNADVIFITDSIGTSEDELGKFYVGKSGQLLTKMIENVLEVSTDNFYITSVTKCCPSIKKTINLNEINICKPYLDKQIELIKPKLIVALGDLSYKHLTSNANDFSNIRGKVLKYNNIDIIPTYHPSFLLRNPSAKKDAFQDMLKIKSIMESF